MPEIFKIPVFQDTERTLKALVFHNIATGTAIIVTLQVIIFWIVLPQNYLRWIVIICTVSIPLLGLLFLNRKGETAIASVLYIFEISALITGLSWSAGGIRSVAFQFIPFLVLVAGILRGWKAGILTGFFACLFGLGLLFAESTGVLPVSRVANTSFNIWLGFFSSITLITLLQFYAVEHLNKALAKANQELDLRNKAEQALKESEERFKALSSLASEGLMIHENGIVVDLNQTFANMLGYSGIEDLIGKYAPDNIQFTPESKKLVLDHLHRKSDDTFDIELINLNGTLIQAETKGIEIIYRGRKASLVYMRDISDRKKAERELEKYQNHLEILVKERTEELDAANEELNISNKELYEQREELQASLNRLQETQIKLVQSEKMASLGVLAAGVAHEINNPLNFIRGGATFIETYFKDKLPGIHEEIREVIEGINTGVNRAAVIVKSLNQYSRSDDLPYTNCNLHDIIDDCLMILNNQLKNRVEVQKQYTEDKYILEGNEGKLHQVFLNILANASQAIDNKGIVTIHSKVVEDDIQISITDNGHGISRENSKKVFDPFFTTKEPGKGTGLGLSITYNIIQEHNGTIDLKSQVGEGTKVIIKLPLKKDSRK